MLFYSTFIIFGRIKFNYYTKTFIFLVKRVILSLLIIVGKTSTSKLSSSDEKPSQIPMFEFAIRLVRKLSFSIVSIFSLKA